MQATHHFKTIAALDGCRSTLSDVAARLRVTMTTASDVRDGIVDRAHAHRMMLIVVVEALAAEVAVLDLVATVRLRNVIELLRQDRIRPTGR